MVPNEIKRILVASDFSERSEEAEAFAVKLAESFGASIVLVNGIEPIDGVDEDDDDVTEVDEFYQVLRDRAETEATKRVEALRSKDIAADYHIEIGPRWLVILEQANAQNADLIILGRRTYARSNTLIFGTTSQKVFFGAARPVLFVPGGILFVPGGNGDKF